MGRQRRRFKNAERGQLAIGPPAKVIDVKAGRYVILDWRTFDVTPDDSRFLMIKEASTEGERGLIVVQNIGEELKRLLPR